MTIKLNTISTEITTKIVNKTLKTINKTKQ
jgi:hypothetical protein